MTRTFPLLRHGLLAILTSAALVLAFSPSAAAQHHRTGGGASGGSTSSGGSGGDGGSKDSGSGGSAHPRSTPTSVSAPSSDGRSAHAVPRGSTGSPGNKSGDSTSTTARDGSHDNSGSGNTDSTVTRPRDGRTSVGQAVARPPYSAGGGTTVIVTGGGYGGYYPWGYGGLGFGGYSGYYDPWYDPYPPVYGGGGNYDYDDGALRLKVKPRDASVYVDGYYAGKVDDFDGLLQKMRLSEGPHRIEVRLQGYESLAFDVRIEPDQTITYHGELKK